MTDSSVSKTASRIAQQQSYFFPSSAGLPPNGPRMLNLREVVSTFSEHRAELKDAERERVSRHVQEAVADGDSPSQTARRVADVVTGADGDLAAAHRVAAETIAQAAPERAPAIIQELAQRLDYQGASTATVDTQA